MFRFVRQLLLNHYMELYEEPGKELTLNQITSADFSGIFETVDTMPFARGLNDHVFWLHFFVKNLDEEQVTWGW